MCARACSDLLVLSHLFVCVGLELDCFFVLPREGRTFSTQLFDCFFFLFLSLLAHYLRTGDAFTGHYGYRHNRRRQLLHLRLDYQK